MEFTLWWKLPPSIKAWPLCFSQWLKGHKVWLKPKALWAYKHARWKPCCCGIFCSRFHPILSLLKIILEMVFWTNLMLDLICTWLEKTRRFCRQVNKNISSCFWTASTCVQRSSLRWCSRLTYMETVDWIHVEKTRRFCRQVNKKISSCFWTASTCVQRSSLGWCSRLTYMENMDWIHIM